MKTENWKKTRDKGRLNYILVRGLLVKGGTSAGLFSLAAPQFLGETATFGSIFPTAAVVFPLAGAIANMAMWPVNEWTFHKLTALEAGTEPNDHTRIVRFRKSRNGHGFRRRKAA